MQVVLGKKFFKQICILLFFKFPLIYRKTLIYVIDPSSVRLQSAATVEYIDGISAEWARPYLPSVLDMTLNNLMARLQ